MLEQHSEISILAGALGIPEIKAALKPTQLILPVLLLELPEFGVNIKCSPKIGLPLLLPILR